MARTTDHILAAIREGRYRVTPHALLRCDERSVAVWQVVLASERPVRVRERTKSRPLPSVVVDLDLMGQTTWSAVWSWDAARRQAALVTVFHQETAHG